MIINCKTTTPRTLSVLVALTFLVTIGSLSRAESPSLDSEAKDYALFIGGNLEIPLDNVFFPVIQVSKKNLGIEVNKTIRQVSIEDVQEYKIVREPKLASLSANIAIVRSERFQAGAARAQLEALSAGIAVQGVMADRQAAAMGSLVQASMSSNSAPIKNSPKNVPGATSPRQEGVNSAINKVSSAYDQNDLVTGSYTARVSAEARSAGSGDLFDALGVDLEITSPKPLSGAHLVLVTECRDPRKPDVLLRRISPQFVGDIGAKPIKVSLEQQGFPTGYILEKERLFLYSGGSEIATNLSDGRMELTREQAFRYLLVQYIASNSKSTLPPTPIMGALPVAFRSKVDAAELNQTVDIAINKNGEITAINSEKDGPAKLSPTVEVALKNFRFFPALKNGLPTDGKVTTKLSELFRNT